MKSQVKSNRDTEEEEGSLVVVLSAFKLFAWTVEVGNRASLVNISANSREYHRAYQSYYVISDCLMMVLNASACHLVCESLPKHEVQAQRSQCQ